VALPPATHEELIALLRDRLPDKRLRHVLGVTALAIEIATHEGLDVDRVARAALLHDLCRTLSKDALLERAADYGLPISALQQAKPMLLHGPVAAEEARRTLGLDDAEVYEAIFWHTTGAPGLRPIGQVVYLADFAELSRDYPEAAEARDCWAQEGFDAALRYVAEQKAANAAKKTAGADPNTVAFLEWLLAGKPQIIALQ